MQAKHKGHKSHESKKKWRNKVEKITELLTVMDKMKAPGGMPFVHNRDISACEDLLEAYFMQVGCASPCTPSLLLCAPLPPSPPCAPHCLPGDTIHGIGNCAQ